MRAAAFRLARADLLGRPGQTALTAFAIFAAATALVVTLALRAGLDEPFADAMEQTNGAHVAVYGELTDAEVATLANLPGVAAAESEPRANVARAAAPAAPSTSGWRACRRRVDRPHVTEGRRPRPPPRCWSSAASPAKRVCRSATPLTLGRHRVRDRRPRRHDRAGDLPALAPGHRLGAGGRPRARRWRVGVRLADPEAIDAFVAAARQALPRRAAGLHRLARRCATRSPTRRAPTR